MCDGRTLYYPSKGLAVVGDLICHHVKPVGGKPNSLTSKVHPHNDMLIVCDGKSYDFCKG